MIGKPSPGVYCGGNAPGAGQGIQSAAHQQNRGEIQLGLYRIGKFVHLIDGFRHIHAHQITPVFADEGALVDNGFIVNGVPRQIGILIGGDRFAKLFVFVNQIPVFRHAVGNIVVQRDDDVILIRLYQSSGIVFFHAADHIRIVSGGNDQVKLGIRRHLGQGLPFRRNANVFGACGNGLKVAIGGHGHGAGHGTKLGLRMKNRKGNAAVC